MGHRPGWLKQWTVDPSACEARHSSGLILKFVEDDHGWEGESPNAQATFSALADEHGPDASAQMLARLMREGGDAYKRLALDERPTPGPVCQF